MVPPPMKARRFPLSVTPEVWRELGSGWLGLTERLVSRREVERRRVDAVPHTRRIWTVREKMAEVRTAAAALDLGPAHAEGAILRGRDMPLLDDVVEARPAGPRLELGPGVEERLPAHDAAIRPLAVVIPVRT